MTLAGIGLAIIALGVAGWIAYALRKAGMGPALLGGFGVPMLALGLYAVLGSPSVPDQPLAARKLDAPAIALGPEQVDFAKMVASLAERLRDRPDDLKGWTILARSYRVLNQWPAASSAWSRVLALKGDSATAIDWAELADLRIAAGRGLVDAQALDAAERSLALDPSLAKSRHFVALAAAQRGDYADAVQRWRALLADAPADAGWREPVSQQLAEVERLLAQSGDGPPPRVADIARPERGPSAADVAAAREMSGQDRAAFIQSMVERLANRLAEEPDDPAGWLRLGRAYGVLGRSEDAASALEKAEQLAMARLQNGASADRPEMQAVLDGVRQLRGN